MSTGIQQACTYLIITHNKTSLLVLLKRTHSTNLKWFITDRTGKSAGIYFEQRTSEPSKEHYVVSRRTACSA